MFLDKTIHQLVEDYSKNPSATQDMLKELLERVGDLNSKLNVYLDFGETNESFVRNQVESLQKSKPSGRLWGVPIAIKDNLCIQGQETACASHILSGFVSPYDATVISKLKAEGAVLIPRVNMDEFAFGSSTENSAFGRTCNPWNLSHVPGGSSGGSAAAVAADLAAASLGSDTGGSIRQPASFCGVVGLKPTYGRVSRYGLVAFASSLDQIGPLTKDVKDAALLLSIIAGEDPKDSTSAPMDVPDYLAALHGDVKGLKVGIPEEYFGEGTDPDVRKAMDKAIDVCTQLGMQCAKVKMPHTPYAVATYYVVATAEASSNLARYDGVKYGTRVQEQGSSLIDMYLASRTQGFGKETQRRVVLGTYVLSQGYYDDYYLKGQKVRTLIRQDFEKAFESFDVLLAPTSPTAAFAEGERSQDPLQMYLSDICTISANLAGVPAISLPCGLTEKGLPIGMQFFAPAFCEDRLFKAAHAYEQATEWHTLKPAFKE